MRLLLDDWRETSRMDWWLTMMEIYPNIEVRVFNPFGGLRSFPLGRQFQAIFGPERLRARMHNKAFITDNSVAIVGGRNIADEYFGASSDVYMRDLDVMAMGPSPGRSARFLTIIGTACWLRRSRPWCRTGLPSMR